MFRRSVEGRPGRSAGTAPKNDSWLDEPGERVGLEVGELLLRRARFAFVMIVSCCVFGMILPLFANCAQATAPNAACCGQFWS